MCTMQLFAMFEPQMRRNLHTKGNWKRHANRRRKYQKIVRRGGNGREENGHRRTRQSDTKKPTGERDG